MDRISELPEPVLHHFLCFLSQEEAVQTCVLSKSWRHLGITRPKIEFHLRSKEKYISVFDKTLQRYLDQNLSIPVFVLSFFPRENPELVAILENWILLALQKGVKKIDFHLGSVKYTSLPTLIFQAQSLEELHLRKCRLNNNSIDKVLLKHLRTLSLSVVKFDEESLNKIFSSCPLIEIVVLDRCKGLTTINVKEVHNLERFECCCCYVSHKTASIQFNSQTLENMRIDRYANWYDHHHDTYFPRLKTLFLKRVRLPTESFGIFLCNFPCLEELQLVSCYGFKQARLSSPTIKRLTIDMGGRNSTKVCVNDVPNILFLEFIGDTPPHLSFTKNDQQLKSQIELVCCVESDDAFSTWFLRVNEMLKALTQSHISLNLCCLYYPKSPITCCDKRYEPVQVDNFIADEDLLGSDFGVSLNVLFRTCRPRYITGMYLVVDAKSVCEKENNKRVDSLCNIFLEGIRGGTTSQRCFWIHDLKEVSMESFDENAQEWRPVQGTSWSECALSNNQSKLKIRIPMTWRES